MGLVLVPCVNKGEMQMKLFLPVRKTVVRLGVNFYTFAFASHEHLHGQSCLLCCAFYENADDDLRQILSQCYTNSMPMLHKCCANAGKKIDSPEWPDQSNSPTKKRRDEDTLMAWHMLMKRWEVGAVQQRGRWTGKLLFREQNPALTAGWIYLSGPTAPRA